MKPPCIKGLKRFEKKGCPQKCWDGKEGCPAWIELPVSTMGNPLKKEIRKQCLDMWLWEFAWASMGQREVVQQATESNRNMMALFSLVTIGRESPEELARVATKNINNKQKLIIEAQGNNNGI